MFCSCSEEDEPLECLENRACTEIFVTFAYAPVDSQDQSILLDSYYSQNLDNGQRYSFTDDDLQLRTGSFTVITDAQIEQLKSTGTTIRFIGIKDSRIVLEQDFFIGHDCCHIIPLEGPGID